MVGLKRRMMLARARASMPPPGMVGRPILASAYCTPQAQTCGP